MSKTKNKYSPEVRERAVRMVLDNTVQHESRWAAIVSVSEKIGFDSLEGVQATLDTLVGSGVLECFDAGPERIYSIAPGQHLSRHGQLPHDAFCGHDGDRAGVGNAVVDGLSVPSGRDEILFAQHREVLGHRRLAHADGFLQVTH